MTRAAFVIPGDIDLPTGGYAYDRKVLARLSAYGVDATHVALPGSFPFPSSDDLVVTEMRLGEIPADAVLLIDGLAYGAMGFELIQRIKQPIVALCHHPLALEAGLDEVKRAHFQMTEQNALARARHVVVTSSVTARILTADFGVAEHGITVAEPGTDRAMRSKGTGQPPHLLAVGSIVPRKGYNVLVEALAAVAAYPWTLTIVGAARDAATLDALKVQIDIANLSDRIVLAGSKSDAELALIYDTADIFVMPSLFEGYGMVIAEAMARGLPIVCTTGGAAAETAPDTAAIKVVPGDACAFGNALRRVLDDANLRRGMAEASWSAGLMLPTWDDTAKRIAAVLNTISRVHAGAKVA
ncbi:MAG: glycosyltransferase family 4 protein [Hyphomicrobiaceae bacterium]